MTRTTAELRQYLALEMLFDNDFKDTSGNGNDGTPTDIEWKPTLRGMKPRYNGSSSKVDCGNDSSLDVGENGFTIFSYLQKNGNSDVLCKRVSSSTGVEFGINTDKISIKMKDSDAIFTGDLISDTTLIDGTTYCVCATVDRINDLVTFYLNGNADGTSVIVLTGTLTCANNLSIGAFDTYSLGYNYSDYLFLDVLTATEVLNLYNETKGEHGVMPAEHSFTHNPDDVINTSDAVGAWGTAKESTTELSDLSGNGNIADIHGAMPAGGFIQGRRYDGDDDSIVFTQLTLDKESASLIEIFKTSADFTSHFANSGSLTGHTDVFYNYLSIQGNGTAPYNLTGETSFNGEYFVNVSSSIPVGKINILSVSFNDGESKTYLNGYLIDTKPITSDLLLSQIGSSGINTFYTGINGFQMISESPLSPTNSINFFNTLARLPFWSINYTDYPDNVATYTNSLPYSSTVISSGTFKVDDDKLQCVSAGTMTYSASYAFDGSEYIKVEIDGVEYAGTGTITQGNTTVSVAQGSNKVTIEAGTGDSIDSIDIQFRAEV